jgi:hypothetical protein
LFERLEAACVPAVPARYDAAARELDGRPEGRKPYWRGSITSLHYAFAH